MNGYEKHCWEIMVDSALTRAPSEIIPTIWKYTKRVMSYMCNESLFGEKQAPFACYRDDSFNAGVAIKGIQFYTTYPEFPYVEAVMNHLVEYQEELLKCNDFKKYVNYMKKYESIPKYELSEQVIKNGKTFYKIKSLKPFSFYYRNKFHIVKKGEEGGWIESESNLSQEGSCWIDKESIVSDNARIKDNALVFNSFIHGNAVVKDFSIIEDKTQLDGNVLIEKNAVVVRSDVHDFALISDKAYITLCKLYDYVEIYGNSNLFDCNISENVWIAGVNLKHKIIDGFKKIKGETNI